MISSKPHRVLFIDDSKIERRLFERTMQSNLSEYRYSVADSVKEAIGLLEESSFDVLVIDYYLGDGTGLDIFNYANERNLQIPVIFLTAAESPDIAIDVMKKGAYDFLQKGSTPSPYSILPITIQNALTEKKKSDDLYMLAKAVQDANDCICVLDLEYNFIFVNKRFSRVYGYQPEALLGVHSSIVWKHLDNNVFKQAFCQFIAKSNPREVRHLKSNGEEFPVMLSASVICDDSGHELAILCIANDRTEDKKAELRQKELEKKLVEARKLESIGRLAGGVAHDFNNILGSVLGYSEMALDDLEPDSLTASNIKEVISAAEKARKLVDQILAFGRGQETQFSLISLPTIVDEVLNLLVPLVPEGVSVKQSLNASIGSILGSSELIQRALMNLCLNAVYAMSDGGELSIEFEEKQCDNDEVIDEPDFVPGDYLILRVKDTGHGIPKAVQDKMFDPFFTTKEVGEGSGIGLSAVLGIVKDHCGFIKCNSEVSKGTEFRLYFPKAQIK